jgi:hypothetical protein
MENESKPEEKVEAPKNIARLLMKEKVVDEMEIVSIPAKITIPTINYIEDPTNFNLKFYNLVFYISNVKTEDNRTIIEYRFKGVEEVR